MGLAIEREREREREKMITGKRDNGIPLSFSLSLSFFLSFVSQT
jgi:hypothetical protein